jgi:fatty acid-binding protein DegV
LNLKPVLQIQGGRLDTFSKGRGKKQAKRIMLEAAKNDLENRFKEACDNGDIHLWAAYGGNPEEAAEWADEIKTSFPQYPLIIDQMSLSIASHIGQGALAIAITKGLLTE